MRELQQGVVLHGIERVAQALGVVGGVEEVGKVLRAVA